MLPAPVQQLVSEGVGWDIVAWIIAIAGLLLLLLCLLCLLWLCCTKGGTEKLYVYQVPDLPVRPVDSFRA